MNTETVVLRNCPEQLRDGNKVIVDKAYLREQQLTTEIFPHPTLKANPLLAPRYPLIDPLTAEDGAKGKCQQREWSQLLSSGEASRGIQPTC